MRLGSGPSMGWSSTLRLPICFTEAARGVRCDLGSRKGRVRPPGFRFSRVARGVRCGLEPCKGRVQLSDPRLDLIGNYYYNSVMSFWNDIATIEKDRQEERVQIGTMKHGGMRMSETKVSLPARFVASWRNNTMDLDDTVFFCNHLPGCEFGNPAGFVTDFNQDAIITWIKQDQIVFQNVVYDLIATPSYRANWSIFRIRGVV